MAPRASPRSATTRSVPSKSTSASATNGSPQRVRDRVDDRGKGTVRFRGPHEHVAEPVHGAPWLVAVAVHEPVHGSLQGVAQRQRDERGRAGRQQLDPDPLLAPDERSERRGDDRVARQDPERDTAVHQRAVDDDIDVEEVVAQDPDGQAEREEQRHDPEPRRTDDRVAEEQLRQPKSARVAAPLATAPKAAQRIRFFAATSVVRR